MAPPGPLRSERHDERHHVEAAPVEKVVDTTGAGDTFAGVLLAYLMDSSELEPAVRAACVAGALSTRHIGGVDSQPTRSEIEALL